MSMYLLIVFLLINGFSLRLGICIMIKVRMEVKVI